MKHRRSEQDEAHELLQEWAWKFESAVSVGFPSAPLSPTVQGHKSEHTAPERYAQRHRSFEKLDRAVRRVEQGDKRMGRVLRVCYLGGKVDESILAEEEGVTPRTLRNWRAKARSLFLKELRALDAGVSAE